MIRKFQITSIFFVLVVLFIGIPVCYPSPYYVSVDIVDVSNLDDYGITDPDALLDVSVCEEHQLSETYMYGPSPNSKSWIFQAAEDLLTLDIWMGTDAIGTGEYISAIEVIMGNAYEDVIAPDFLSGSEWVAQPPSHMHFYNGSVLAGDYVSIGVNHGGHGSYPMDQIYFHATPIPSAVLLLGSGLIGIVGIRRKFKKEIAK